MTKASFRFSVSMVPSGFTCPYFVKIDIFRGSFSLQLWATDPHSEQRNGGLDWCLQQNHTFGVGEEDESPGQAGRILSHREEKADRLRSDVK